MSVKNKLLSFSFLLSFLLFLCAPKTNAAEFILATVKTDVDNNTYNLVVDANDETNSLTAFFIDSYSNGKLDHRDALAMNTFIQEGFRFKNFAKISTSNFNEDLGGMITIETLSNILTGRRKSYEMHLAKDKSDWGFFKDGRKISEILAVANKVPIFGIVGAKELIMK